MKFEIESLEDSKAKVSLILNRKLYEETWNRINQEYWGTEGSPILSQLIDDGVKVENTELEIFLMTFDIQAFIKATIANERITVIK